jgi:hypothetical protein
LVSLHCSLWCALDEYKSIKTHADKIVMTAAHLGNRDVNMVLDIVLVDSDLTTFTRQKSAKQYYRRGVLGHFASNALLDIAFEILTAISNFSLD